MISIPLRDCEVSDEISSVVISPVFTGSLDEETNAVEIEAVVYSVSDFSDLSFPVPIHLVESRSGFQGEYNRVSLDITRMVVSHAQCGTTVYVLLGSLSDDPGHVTSLL